jgi:hypothetical protein
MRLNRYLGLGLVLAMVSTSALAFQEQNGQTAAPSTAPQSQATDVAPSASEAAVAPDAAAPVASKGTEVRIPGLGRLGVLPKMDFGLELLYGASEPKPAEEDQAPADDLTIRGTIKHPF